MSGLGDVVRLSTRYSETFDSVSSRELLRYQKSQLALIRLKLFALGRRVLPVDLPVIRVSEI